MLSNSRYYITVFFAILVFSFQTTAFAQDTVKVSLNQFIEKVKENSGRLKFERENVNLAENKISEARSRRILPKFDLTSQHGLVPGVKSDSVLPNGRPLPRGQFYLDPNLRNDWEDWAISSRLEISALQPIFTWGAINKAVSAAKEGADAALKQFESVEANVETQIFDLYYSYILMLEIERVLKEADDTIKKIGDEIQEMKDNSDPDLDESDVFKFEIFKAEFEIQRSEFYTRMVFVQDTWNYLLGAGENTIYQPSEEFLEPLSQKLMESSFYKASAIKNRPEIEAFDAGIRGVRKIISTVKSQNLPAIFLGLTGNYGYTPNRPRQDNPFIINNTNFSSAAFGIVIRQNLSFFSLKSAAERGRIELRRVEYMKDAAMDGIMLEVNSAYSNAKLSEVKVSQTDKALVLTKNWLRLEQLDYDLGFGETKDLIDAIKKELELKLKLKESVFEHNSNMAKLNKAAGIPVQNLNLTE